MGKLVVTEFVSLDGVMEAPGGEDFKYPGWSFEFDRGEDGNKFKLDETLETEVMLIGRKTYESFANAWPCARGRVRGQVQHDAENTSSRRRSKTRSGTTRTTKGDDDVLGEVAKLKEDTEGIVQVPGSLGSCRSCSRTTSSTSSTSMSPDGPRHGPAPLGETSDKWTTA